MTAYLSGSPHVLESFISPKEHIGPVIGIFLFLEQLVTWPTTGPNDVRYLGLESGAEFSSVSKPFEKFCLNFILKFHF